MCGTLVIYYGMVACDIESVSFNNHLRLLCADAYPMITACITGFV